MNSELEEDIIEINAVEPSRRRKLVQGVLVDTGAGVTIADGGEEFPEYELEPSEDSRKGQTYRGPGKTGVIHNRGQRRVRLRLGAEDGQLVGMKFQDAEVRRPILSVNESVRAGQMFVFDEGGSVILPQGCPEQVEIRRLVEQAARKLTMQVERGVHKLDAWVEPPSIPFAR